ncbi:MAG: hypothetical protein K2X28_08900 [Alphaproteobacteria bacterium]|nr:hypothetical protein [Alphaproteobacteria bacterium]
MKKKILLSTLSMVLFSITSAFSMETDGLEKKQLSIRACYYNNAPSNTPDREKFDKVSFTLSCSDGEKEETMGSFTFNVNDKIPDSPWFFSYNHGEDKMRTVFLSLNQKNPWEIKLYPEEDSVLKTLYAPDGLSYGMKWPLRPAVFSPSEIGLYSFLRVEVQVGPNPLGDGLVAEHFLILERP